MTGEREIPLTTRSLPITLIEKDGVHDAKSFFEAIKSSNLTENEPATVKALEDYFATIKRASSRAKDSEQFLFFQGAIAGMLIAFKIQRTFLEHQAHEKSIDPKTGEKRRPN